MADLKRWFKVWTTITHDPHFQQLALEDVGRWTMLGALMVSVGSHGRLDSPAGGRALCHLLRVNDFDALKVCIKRLPHVLLEEGKSDNGDFTVIIENWFKYQEDSTAYERVKRSRSKRRGEKNKRREEVPPKPPEPISLSRSDTAEPERGDYRSVLERLEARMKQP